MAPLTDGLSKVWSASAGVPDRARKAPATRPSDRIPRFMKDYPHAILRQVITKSAGRKPRPLQISQESYIFEVVRLVRTMAINGHVISGPDPGAVPGASTRRDPRGPVR